MFLGGPYFRAGAAHGANRLHGKAVAQHRVVSHLIEGPVFKQDAGSVHQPNRLALHVQFDATVRRFRHLLELVDGEEVADPVAEGLRNDAGVLAERLRGLGGLPASVSVLQGLRQIPVVERCEGLDVGCLQFVHQPIVEVEPLLIELSSAVREDAWPGNREAIGLRTDVPHQRDVL